MPIQNPILPGCHSAPSICGVGHDYHIVNSMHPAFKASQPNWINEVPAGMAHGTYRLDLHWNGHVGQWDVNLKTKPEGRRCPVPGSSPSRSRVTGKPTVQRHRDGINCFGWDISCSAVLMTACAEAHVSLSFHNPQGESLAASNSFAKPHSRCGWHFKPIPLSASNDPRASLGKFAGFPRL